MKLLIPLLFFLTTFCYSASIMPYQINTNVTHPNCNSDGSITVNLVNNYCTNLFEIIENSDCLDSSCYNDWLMYLQANTTETINDEWYDYQSLTEWYINANNEIDFENLRRYLTDFVYVDCWLTPQIDACNFTINIYNNNGELIGNGSYVDNLVSGIYYIEVIPLEQQSNIDACFGNDNFCPAKQVVILNDFDFNFQASIINETCTKMYDFGSWPIEYFGGSHDAAIEIAQFGFNDNDYAFEWFDFSNNAVANGLIASGLRLTPQLDDQCETNLFKSYYVKVTNQSGCNYFRQFTIGTEHYVPEISISATTAICNRPCDEVNVDLLGEYFSEADFENQIITTWLDGEVVHLYNHNFYPGEYEIIVEAFGACFDTVRFDVPYFCYLYGCTPEHDAIKTDMLYTFNDKTQHLYKMNNGKFLFLDDGNMHLFENYNDTLLISFDEHCTFKDDLGTGEIDITVASTYCIDYKKYYNQYMDNCGENFDIEQSIFCDDFGTAAIYFAIYGDENQYFYDYIGDPNNQSGVIDMGVNQQGVFFIVADTYESGSSPYELTIYNEDETCVTYMSGYFECHKNAIELLSFQAHQKNEVNLITWQTASAIDEEYFVLQHSTNGIDFNEVTRVPVVNHSSGIESYSFEHISISAKNYYKLLTVDVGGVKRQISNVIEVNQSSTQLINIYPTTTSDIVNVFPPTTNVKVYNAYGQLMDVKNQNGQIDLSNFTSGVYFLETQTQKFKVFKL